jgi:hypothetical protein
MNPSKTNLDMGGALRELRAGEKVTRAGWNGKGMWLVLMPGYVDTGIIKDTSVHILPYIVMRTVDGSMVMWTASQTDLLAEDWMVVS